MPKPFLGGRTPTSPILLALCIGFASSADAALSVADCELLGRKISLELEIHDSPNNAAGPNGPCLSTRFRATPACSSSSQYRLTLSDAKKLTTRALGMSEADLEKARPGLLGLVVVEFVESVRDRPDFRELGDRLGIACVRGRW